MHIHWNQRERRADGHAYKTPNEFSAMQARSLGAQGVQNIRDFAGRNQSLWIDNLDHVGALKFVVLSLGGKRRDGLQAPLLVWNPPKSLVSVVDDGFLPARVFLLPSRPGLRRFCLYLVRPPLALLGGVDVQVLGVQQGPSRRNGKQEQSHFRSKVPLRLETLRGSGLAVRS